MDAEENYWNNGNDVGGSMQVDEQNTNMTAHHNLN